MASTEFIRLHEKAHQREHALISEIQNLWISLEMTDFQAAIRLARGLQEAHQDFLEGMEPIAQRMGRTLMGQGCPHCGDPNCPGANAGPGGVVIVGGGLGKLAQAMMQLLTGKPPQQPPKPPEDQQK